MFRKIWARFHLWSGTAKTVSHLITLDQRCRLADAENQKVGASFTRAVDALAQLREDFTEQVVVVEQRIRDVERVNKRYEETLNELRAELRVANDVTIPSLVASHKLILARYDAEVAIAVRRGVSGMPRVEE